MKVVIGLALVGLLLGLGVHYGRSSVSAATHHVLDTPLPSELEKHPWAPVVLGHVRRTEKVVFTGGQVQTVRCHANLGSYHLTVLHAFAFDASNTPIRAHCAGAPALRRALGRVTRVDADRHDGHESLTFSDGDETVLVLRATG